MHWRTTTLALVSLATLAPLAPTQGDSSAFVFESEHRSMVRRVQRLTRPMATGNSM